MLVRVYRFTDKFGLVFIKSGAAFSDWLLKGVQILIGTRSDEGPRGLLGLLIIVLSLIWAAIGIVIGLISTLVKTLSNILTTLVYGLFRAVRAILQMVGGFWGFVINSLLRVTGASLQNVGSISERNMARRKARAEMDVGLAEDPLRSQNRVLSGLVIVLGIAVIAVLIWATDPSRQPPSNSLVANVNFLSALSQGTPDSNSSVVIGTEPTPIPTATQIPAALQSRGTIAYVVRERGQDDIWAVGVGSRNPIRLVNSPKDDRDPAWSPNGRQLAYASRQDDNWEIYIYNLDDRSTVRMTFDLGFQAGPQWSNDGLFLAYESYQGNNLDIFAMPVDGLDTPIRITDHPLPDYSPAWEPTNGRQIAFVSLRDGNQDIYVFNLDDFSTINVTNTPNRDEDFPGWSPNGRYLAYSGIDQGREKVFVHDMENVATPPRAVAVGRTPAWSPDGVSLAFTANSDDNQSAYLYAVPFEVEGVAIDVLDVPYGTSSPSWTTTTLPPQLVNAGGQPLSVTEPLYIEQETRFTGDPAYRLNSLLDVQAQSAVLSDRVNDSFNALRERVVQTSGWDYLGTLEDAFWGLDRRPEPGEERRNWHMTGRAFAVSRSSILGFPPPIELVREDLWDGTYWRVFVRVTDEAQSGQLGEPLRHIPWDLLSRTQGDVEAYNQGGRKRVEIPAGYYVDYTQIAEDYGWTRVPAGTDWRANADTVHYWMFQKRDGLDWYNAMREIYGEDQLGGFVPTATPSADQAGG